MTPILFVGYLLLFIYIYRRARRRRIGPAMVGQFYEAMTQDRRQAIEMIVEEKAEERDPERAAGPPRPRPSDAARNR